MPRVPEYFTIHVTTHIARTSSLLFCKEFAPLFEPLRADLRTSSGVVTLWATRDELVRLVACRTLIAEDKNNSLVCKTTLITYDVDIASKLSYATNSCSESSDRRAFFAFFALFSAFQTRGGGPAPI